MSFHAEAAYGFHFATRRARSHTPIRLNPMYEPIGSSEGLPATFLQFICGYYLSPRL
jgi:hypothetical protein